ncbi:MAG: hypothetical protein M3Q48_02310, partial [Actinomycetota bacterium]|nr:hypothetical protein [Actinomycetota bacterium]
MLGPVATLVSPDLVVVGHVNDGHDTVGQGRDQASWYVSPVSVVQPEHVAEAPDTGAAEAEPQDVLLAVEHLIRLMPALARVNADVEATVFAGYKQDLDGQPARPAVEQEQRVAVPVAGQLGDADVAELWVGQQPARERHQQLVDGRDLHL